MTEEEEEEVEEEEEEREKGGRGLEWSFTHSVIIIILSIVCKITVI